MKIFISENIDKSIDGYKIIPIIYGEVDLQSIPNNAATDIVAIDAIDSIKYADLSSFISKIASKMRLNSNLYLGGLDLFALSRELLNGSKSVEEYNAIVNGKNGIYSSSIILDLLRANGIKINSVVYKGNRYEISATRPDYKN